MSWLLAVVSGEWLKDSILDGGTFSTEVGLTSVANSGLV